MKPTDWVVLSLIVYSLIGWLLASMLSPVKADGSRMTRVNRIVIGVCWPYALVLAVLKINGNRIVFER